MAPLLQPGDVFAGHTIIRHIASNTAQVYVAMVPTGELRALKIIAMTEDGAAKLQARLAQEGEVLATIVHLNVVRVRDAGVCGNVAWLSLELVEGETLRQMMAAGGRLPLDEVLGWIQQACEGLAEAHRCEVVHRDLTPDKLIVTPCGTLKIIDFGMAKLSCCGLVTTTEQQIGSAWYSAPEQLREARRAPSAGRRPSTTSPACRRSSGRWSWPGTSRG